MQQQGRELLPEGALSLVRGRPFRLLCWLAKHDFSVAVVRFRTATQAITLCSPRLVASVLHAASLNPSRTNAAHGAPGSRLGFVARAFGAASGNRVACGSPARPSNHRVTAGATRPETTGAPQRRATATSQAAGKLPESRHQNTREVGGHRQKV